MSAEFITQPAPTSTTQLHRIVVGFDGSAGSIEAVEWAAREAERRSSALRVVTCWAVPADIDYYGIGERQRQSLAEVVDALHGRHGGLAISSAATNLGPRDALIAETENTDLLVIGSTEVGAATQMLLGSVAKTAARRSACPVVIVNGVGARSIATIAVGVDGSRAAATALDWACAEANLHGSSITLVHAREADMFLDEAQRVLETAVDECRVRTTSTVSAELAEGSATEALVRASENADLVVVGSRGRGRVMRALFGSVALVVSDKASCPVAITHPRIRRDPAIGGPA